MSKLQLSRYLALAQIKQTGAGLRKQAEKYFSQYKLTDAQFTILQILKKNGGKAVSHKQLVDDLFVSRANISIIIDRMERAGYITRSYSKDDRRIKGIKITASGKKRLLQVEKKYKSQMHKILKNLTDSDCRVIKKVLDKVQVQ